MLGSSEVWKLALLVVALGISAFFSGSEAALLSVQRVRLAHMVARGVARAEWVERMVRRPERFLPTVLLGNNLMNTAAAALGTAVAISVMGSVNSAILVSTIGVTLLLLIFGETLPKIVASAHAERISLEVVRPLRWLELLLFPLARGLQALSLGVARLFGRADVRSLVTEEEIRALISVGGMVGSVDMREAEMLERVFHFGDRQLRDVMTPRTEIVWLERDTTLKGFLEVYADHYHTRFPMFDETVDNVIGILSAKDVLRESARGQLKDTDSVTRLLRPVHLVPETKTVASLFSELRQQGQQMAMVVDEFGGIAGLVTIRQLLEVIVGPVGEEGMPLEEQYATIDKDTYHIDGAMPVVEANEKLGLQLPLGNYQTVAGFVLEHLKHIPRPGERFRYGDLSITVKDMRGPKIELLDVRHTTQRTKGPS